jgi:hypothetical protein
MQKCKNVKMSRSKNVKIINKIKTKEKIKNKKIKNKK